MRSNIAVLCPFRLDGGLITKAVSLCQNTPLRVLVPHCDADAAMALGAKFIHTVDAVCLGVDEQQITQWLKEFVLREDINIILAPATVRMRCIISQLAFLLNAGLTADCIDVSVENETLIQIRPAFGSTQIATITSHSSIQIATVRPDIFPVIPRPCKDSIVIPETFLSEGGRIKQLSIQSFTEQFALTQAKIVIAGGLGIGSREGFDKLHRLASVLDASVAASRSAVDAGFAPYDCQVGITGKAVKPEVYLAFGISGAVQHLAGISGARKIIAVNKDKHAPIFDYADYAVVADWETVVDKLLEELS